jgi:F420-dependent oxidoreductase-like protein
VLIGLNSRGPTLGATIADVQRAEQEGFAAYSMAGDATSTLALVGAQTERIHLLTAVVPIFGIHPAVLARQAQTAQEAANGRFTLGIGLSHQVSVEGRLGISFDRPAARMREYLQILMPLLRGDSPEFEGEYYTYRGASGVEGRAEVSCAIAALAPVMLRLAGERTSGTILWMANAKAVDDYIAPRIRRAANDAGRDAPEIICSLPIALTDDAAGAREEANRQFAMYGTLPSYRAVLDRGDAADPGDVALVGNEARLDAELDRLERAGVTTFNASIFRSEQGGPARTREYLVSRARERNGATG